MNIREIHKGSEILLPVNAGGIIMPSFPGVVQGITLHSEIIALHTIHKKGRNFELKHCGPIELTEDVLFVMGFERGSFCHDDKSVTPIVYRGFGFILQFYSEKNLKEIDTDNIMVMRLNLDGSLKSICMIKSHVHLLQNVLFDVAQVEVTYVNRK